MKRQIIILISQADLIDFMKIKVANLFIYLRPSSCASSTINAATTFARFHVSCNFHGIRVIIINILLSETYAQKNHFFLILIVSLIETSIGFYIQILITDSIFFFTEVTGD